MPVWQLQLGRDCCHLKVFYLDCDHGLQMSCLQSLPLSLYMCGLQPQLC
jgi:hypothetical protein